jgi:Uma2 family endonuclease
MTSPVVKHMNVNDFLAWAETQDKGRYELIRGEIVAMAPERAEHAQAKRRAANALEAAIQRVGVNCEAFVDGLAVKIDEETSYEPDALVNCGEPVARDSMIAPNPVVVVEVGRLLSPAKLEPLLNCGPWAPTYRALSTATKRSGDSRHHKRG